jgi:hypothetical protein
MRRILLVPEIRITSRNADFACTSECRLQKLLAIRQDVVIRTTKMTE